MCPSETRVADVELVYPIASDCIRFYSLSIRLHSLTFGFHCLTFAFTRIRLHSIAIEQLPSQPFPNELLSNWQAKRRVFNRNLLKTFNEIFSTKKLFPLTWSQNLKPKFEAKKLLTFQLKHLPFKSLPLQTRLESMGSKKWKYFLRMFLRKLLLSSDLQEASRKTWVERPARGTLVGTSLVETSLKRLE